MHTAEARQTYKSRMPITELEPKHVENCKVLVNRQALLARLPQHGIVAEFGVDMAVFSMEILNIANPQTLYLVDGWVGERYANNKLLVEEKLASNIEKGQVRLLQGMSTDMLKSFEDHFFDWIYIDTDHSYGTTMWELKIAKNKIKKGGRIAGHDFCTGNVISPVPYGVVEACCRFCKENSWGFEYLTLESHGHFSFCLREI